MDTGCACATHGNTDTPTSSVKTPNLLPWGEKKNQKQKKQQQTKNKQKQKNKLADRKVKPEIFVCQKKFCIQSTKGLQIEYGVSIDMKQRANSQGLFSYNQL